jgi:predicted dinucleotide-binding enzyme
MKIGIIGTGKVGLTLAEIYAAHGHKVLVANSRGAQSVREMLAQSNEPIVPANLEEVLHCPIVVLATPWLKVAEVLPVSQNWGGRILIDTTNIYLSYKDELVVADLHGDSGSEVVARYAPSARVVKAFNTLPFDVMFSPTPINMKRALIIAGDDKGAVEAVSKLVSEIGLYPVVAGNLASAGRQMEIGGPFSLLNLLVPVKDGVQA